MAGENSYEEETTSELVERTFEVAGLRVQARTNMIEPGVEARLEEVGVWVSRDISNGPPAWLGKSEPSLAPAIFLNAARLDTDAGIARITQKLTTEFLLSLEEATRVVEQASIAAGLREVEQTLRKDRALLAAGRVRQKREEAKQLALTAGREAMRLEVGAETFAQLMAPSAAGAGATENKPAPPSHEAAPGSSLAPDEEEQRASLDALAALNLSCDVPPGTFR